MSTARKASKKLEWLRTAQSTPSPATASKDHYECQEQPTSVIHDAEGQHGQRRSNSHRVGLSTGCSRACTDKAGREFNEYVNMSATELEKWLAGESSQDAGWSKEDGETVGHER